MHFIELLKCIVDANCASSDQIILQTFQYYTRNIYRHLHYSSWVGFEKLPVPEGFVVNIDSIILLSVVQANLRFISSSSSSLFNILRFLYTPGTWKPKLFLVKKTEHD